MTVVNRTGTYCVVIAKQLAVSICPIRTCSWRGADGFCKYSVENEGLDVQGLATLLGRPVPDAENILKIKADLLMAVRSLNKA